MQNAVQSSVTVCFAREMEVDASKDGDSIIMKLRVCRFLDFLLPTKMGMKRQQERAFVPGCEGSKQQNW